MTGQQLKNSILQMAVQGKLVPQDPNDEPASVLLERIRAEKEQLIKEGKIKKEKNPSIIFRGADNLPYEKIGKNEPICIADDVPFEIPESWEWVRWGTLSESIQYGYNAPAQENGRIKMVRISDIQDNSVMWETVPYCDIKEGEIDAYLLKPNDILFARTGGTVGKSYLVQEIPEEAIYAGYLIRTRYSNQLCPQYLKYFMESELYWSQLREGTIATAQPNCNGKTLGNMLVPIPPSHEQIRIVEKLNAVMAHVIEYGTIDSRSKHLNNIFPERLKKSILQEAVQGKLVPQDPNDEPAAVLLERIRAEKQKLIAEGKIKKNKHESIIFRRDNSHYEKLDGIEHCIDDEIPFEIPETWEWIRLGSLFTINPRNNIADDTVVGFMPMPLLKDGFHSGHTYETKLWKDVKSGFTHFANNDVVIAKITPCFQNRKSAVIHDLPSGYGAGTTELHVLRDYTKMLYIPYFLMICKTHDFIQNGMKNFSGTAGQQRVGKDFIFNYLVPLPPVNEQKRIVEKVNVLIKSCDIL
ncbi:restriction endonuclease subunit S [Ruminococcus hominis]|uniref:Restriction endonuclease subunit S n=1 Tax=Ruminococcus hominis TaxID=2763065 RepID=A0ABR7G6Q0_9FIRM|nr:restriction endonuclease subunit S [Ruminococcus hominis]MBC5683105.1 restriction endonuclease subunit S [Ruminococcus hominis]